MTWVSRRGGSQDSSSASEGSGDKASGTYQDTIQTKRADLGAAVLEDELVGAADSEETLSLDVTVHRVGDAFDEDVERRDGDVAMSFAGRDAGVAYEVVGAPAVFGGGEIGTLASLRGEFEVEASESDDGTPVYMLTRTGQTEPVARDDSQTCQSEGVDARAADAATSLQDASLEGYEALRDEWASAPRVWARIKGYAATESGDEAEILANVCAEHRE